MTISQARRISKKALSDMIDGLEKIHSDHRRLDTRPATEAEAELLDILDQAWSERERV